MKKILVFGASNSKHSINKQFAIYAAQHLSNVELQVADLNDYKLPLYSIDLQREEGVDANAIRFSELIQESDAIVLSLAEYNGLHTSAFKNLCDWMSRIPMDPPMHIWQGKPMFLLSTSPSQRPVNNVLRVSKELFPSFGARIIADFYLPSFHHFFRDDEIIDEVQRTAFNIQKNKFQASIDALD